jgi:TolA-binding protein
LIENADIRMVAMFNDLKGQFEQQLNITAQLQGEIDRQTDLENQLNEQIIQLQGDIDNATTLKDRLEKDARDSQDALRDQFNVIEVLEGGYSGKRVSFDGYTNLSKGAANHLAH